MVADKLHGMDARLIIALRNGTPVPDAKLNALLLFTRETVLSRERPDLSDVNAFYQAGYDGRAVLAEILAISMKTLSNYVNIMSQTPLDPAFADYKYVP